MSTRQISDELRNHFGVSISHASIARHIKNHYLPEVQKQDDPLAFLDEIGRTRLKRAIYKSIKLIKKLHICRCLSPTSFRRRGVLYICKTCGGWYPANAAMKIMKERRWEKKGEEEILAYPVAPVTRY